MENMWKFEMDETEGKTPKEFLKEQADLLPALTGDMVYASVREESGFAMKGFTDNDFVFSLNIRSKFLRNYNFRVLTLGHGIPIYPVYVMVDDEIKKELQISGEIEVFSEKEFKETLKYILSCNRINTVINSLIKLSK